MAFCQFCDDVRMEIGNKPSFMGLYSGQMVFPEQPLEGTPVIIPRLVIIPWLFTAREDPPQKLNVILYGPPGKTIIFNFPLPVGGREPVVPFADSTELHLHAIIPTMNMTFMHTCVLEVVLETERETLRAGRLRIVIPNRPDPGANEEEVNPSHTALPPASGKSGHASQETKKPRARFRRPARRSARNPGQG
jgi:hypothetical protein